MNLDFDDPNCLIDDSTPVEPETLDWVTALQGQQISVKKLEFSEDIKEANFDSRYSLSGAVLSENCFYTKKVLPVITLRHTRTQSAPAHASPSQTVSLVLGRHSHQMPPT
jgi:hypothetical protein